MYLNEVKWIKFPVGFTSMPEFIEMRGVKTMRDKLGCFWIELFDIAGRLDQNGKLLRNSGAMTAEELARMVSRKKQTVDMCLEWYLKEGLLTIDGETGAYQIKGWEDIQSTEKMKKLRLARAEKKAAHTEGAASEDNKQENNKKENNRKEENRIEENKIEEKKKEEKNDAAPSEPEKDFETKRLEALDKLKRKSEEERARREKDPEKAAQYQRLKEEYERAKMRRMNYAEEMGTNL